MDERQLVLGRGSRADGDEVACVDEMVEEHAQSIGALRMAASRVVRQHPSIQDDARTRHAGRR